MASPRTITIGKEIVKETIEAAGKIVEKGKTKKATELLEKKPIKVKVGDDVTQTKKDVDTVITVSKKDFKVKKPKVDELKSEVAAWKVTGSKITPKILDDFNINKIKTKDDIIKLIDITSKLYKDDIGKAKRGVQSWEQTKRLATILQNNPEKLQSKLLTLKPGETLNAEYILAARELLVAGMSKLDELAKAASKGNVDDVLAFRQHFALMGEFQKVLKGVQTETARALNQFRIPTRSKKFTNVDLDKLNQEALLVEMGGVDDIRGVAHLYLNAGTNQAKLKLAQDAGALSNLRKASDSVAEIFLNAILSNPYTHVRNAAGNWITQGINQIERNRAAAWFGKTQQGGLAPYEDVAKGFGHNQAAQEMLAAIATAWRKEGPAKFLKNFDQQIKSNFGGTSKIELRPDRFSSSNFNIENKAVAKSVDYVGTMLTLGRVPTKMLTVMDNWFKNREFRSELYAIAYREAFEMYEKGLLKRNNMADFIADRVVNPTKKAVQEAYDQAHMVTYQTKLAKQKGNKLAEYGNVIQTAKNRSGFMSWLSNYYLPFVQTPTNIAGFVAERTPGLAQIVTRYNKDIAAGGVREQMARTRLRLGAMFYMATAPMGYFSVAKGSNIDVPGKFTGSKSETLKALGIQGNDIRVHVGNDKYWSANTTGFDPINLALSMSANSGKYLQLMFSPEEGHTDFSIPNYEDALSHTLALTLGIGEIMSNSTFLMGTTNFFKDVQMATKAGSGDINGSEFSRKWWNRFSSSFIPTGVKETSKLWTDDYRKIKDEWDEWVMSKIDDRHLYDDFTIFGEKINKWGYLNSHQMTPAKELFEKVKPKIRPIKKYMQGEFAGITVTTPLKSNEISFIKENAGVIFNKKMEELVSGNHVDSALILNENTEEVLKQSIIRNLWSEAKTDARAFLKSPKLMTETGEIPNDMYYDIEDRLLEAKQNKILTGQKGKTLKDDNLQYEETQEYLMEQNKQ